MFEAWAYYESKRREQSVEVSKTRGKLLAQVSSDTTPKEFALLLKEFAASLKEGHSQVYLGALPDPFPYSWPIGFLPVRDGPMVASLNWLKNNPGIELGDVLVKVDDRPVEVFLDSRMALTSASTEHARRVMAVDQIHWSANPSVRLEFEKRDGTRIEGLFQCLPHRVKYRIRETKRFCTQRTLPDGFVEIEIPSFTWNSEVFNAATDDRERDAALDAAKAQVDQAFAAARSAPGLILDLRDNDGGFELLSTYVAEHLVSGDFNYYHTERHDSALLRFSSGYQNMNNNAFGTRIPQYPRRWQGFRHFEGQPFSGPLVVLINERCFSTTDNLCAFLRDVRPQTKFVGRTTNGGTGEPTIVDTLANCRAQIQFCVSRVYSPNGRMIEGTGTHPDLQVERDRNSMLERRDLALELALNLLRGE